MKRIASFTLLLGIFFAQAVFAQVYQYKITLDVSQMVNPDCWLNQGAVTNNRVYIHSGMCYSNPQFCTDSICHQGSNIWQAVVGNWGMDDGVGLMTFEGNNKWSMTMIPDVYYGQPGATAYTLGMVFRSFDGGYEGKDDLCADIFIKNMQSASPTVVGCDGSPFAPVTVEKTLVVGLADPTYLGGLTVGPNPSSGQVNIDYRLVKDAEAFDVSIYAANGQKLRSLLQGSQTAGAHRLQWNGRDALGNEVANGLYYLMIRDGATKIGSQKILMMR